MEEMPPAISSINSTLSEPRTASCYSAVKLLQDRLREEVLSLAVAPGELGAEELLREEDLQHPGAVYFSAAAVRLQAQVDREAIERIDGHAVERDPAVHGHQ